MTESNETLKPCPFCKESSHFVFTQDTIQMPMEQKRRLGMAIESNVFHKFILCMGCGAKVPAYVWNQRDSIN